MDLARRGNVKEGHRVRSHAADVLQRLLWLQILSIHVYGVFLQHLHGFFAMFYISATKLPCGNLAYLGVCMARADTEGSVANF